MQEISHMCVDIIISKKGKVTKGGEDSDSGATTSSVSYCGLGGCE
jgi:hypothetical protein